VTRSVDAELHRLRTALAAYQHALLPQVPDLAGHRPAAVLAPILRRPEGLSLLFMERPADGSAHGGQISFPGGKVDAGDADHVAAALREAEEEVGLPRRDVEVLGRLSELATPTGYLITPVVGLVDAPPASWRISPAEVREAFEVPLALLRDATVFEDRGEIQRWGMTFHTCAYRPSGRFIWGATARVLRELLTVWAE
jgi:8-oxo-dGTP pyrophosphatase MutT (NUDIX family)